MNATNDATTTFNQLSIIEPILSAIIEKGYTNPTPIQERAIPIILNKQDLLGCAQTGTGKTAAFAIPILQLLSEMPSQPGIKTLVLTPTRELAIQIHENFKEYGKNLSFKSIAIFGGVNQSEQIRAIREGIDILVATPGRLLDLMQQKVIKLDHIKFFVLDEADRMLDMGFINEVNRVIEKLPTVRQTLLFSATMPRAIEKLANKILIDPADIAVTPVSSTAQTIRQFKYFVDRTDKKKLLQYLITEKYKKSALIFTRTKHGADRLKQDLIKKGFTADAIHGDKSQNARQVALQDFKSGYIKYLIATDIAARGIDIEELSLVINFEVPEYAENYVHRIGRTGRAGNKGTAITLVDVEEKDALKEIEKLIDKEIPTEKFHPFIPKDMKLIQNVKQFRAPKGKDIVMPKNAIPAFQHTQKPKKKR